MKMVRARVPSLLKKGGRAFTDREHFQDMKIEITIQTDKNKKTKNFGLHRPRTSPVHENKTKNSKQ